MITESNVVDCSYADIFPDEQNITITVPVGSVVYTPEQLEARREAKKREENKLRKRDANNELGYYFFIPSDSDFEGVSPESVTRLIYLNTFMNYDDNKLMLTERTPMKRKDLAETLLVSKATITKFWREVSPKYIRETEEGLIFTNKDIFKRGKLTKGKAYKVYQTFYVNGVRTLYQTTQQRNHKHLGYIFKMLPFINLEYNILCFNPWETDLHKIQIVTVADFCEVIDFDFSHLRRLLKIYDRIRFDVKGEQERFCSFTYDGIHRESMSIFVNPHILYSGSDYNKVEVLGEFCRDRNA